MVPNVECKKRDFKMDYRKYTKDELVTMCQVYKHKIDYLDSLKIHDSLHSVSDMFSFAKYLKENYDYHDNTEDGDIYIHKGNKLKYTEDKIYLTWSNYR